MNKILERWSLARRFGVFAVLALALVAAPLSTYIKHSQEAIATAAAEKAGLEPVGRLLRLVQLTQQHRDLSANVLGGRADLEPRRAAKQAEVDEIGRAHV